MILTTLLSIPLIIINFDLITLIPLIKQILILGNQNYQSKLNDQIAGLTCQKLSDIQNDQNTNCFDVSLSSLLMLESKFY